MVPIAINEKQLSNRVNCLFCHFRRNSEAGPPTDSISKLRFSERALLYFTSGWFGPSRGGIFVLVACVVLGLTEFATLGYDILSVSGR